MNLAIVSDARLAQWLAAVDAVSARARQLAGTLAPAQLTWHRPTGGWSVGEVLEHLVTADSLYEEGVRRALRGARRSASPVPASAWRGTLVGSFLVRMLDPNNSRRVPAPRKFQPGPTARPGVLAIFLERQELLKGWIREAEGSDLNRARLSSPVSRLIRLNLGDYFEITIVHTRRHMQQIQRVVDDAAFPKSGAPRPV